MNYGAQDADEDNKEKTGGIQVLERASKILRALSVHPRGLSLAEIAQAVSVPRSTVQRIVNSLVSENVLESVGPVGGFRLGPALGQMIYQSQVDIVSSIRPYIEKLSQDLSETVCLSHIKGPNACIIDFVVGEQLLRIVPKLGMSVPNLGAGGKVILATMSNKLLQEWLTNNACSPFHTKENFDLLLRELDEIRDRGYASDNEKSTEGISAIAISVVTYRGPYAITLVVPSSRMRVKRNDYLKHLKDTVTGIERIVGIKACSH